MTLGVEKYFSLLVGIRTDTTLVLLLYHAGKLFGRQL